MSRPARRSGSAATAAGPYASLTAASVAAFYPRPGVAYVPVDDVSSSEVAIAWHEGDQRPSVKTLVAAAQAIARVRTDARDVSSEKGALARGG